MKFLVVGLGSMGKRRIRNLQELHASDIVGFDIRKDRRKEASELYSIKVADSFESALSTNPDVMIISTSPDKHLEYALTAVSNKIHFFTEVNTAKPEEIQTLIDLLKQNKVIGIPSSTLRFHASVNRIRHLLSDDKIGKVLLLNYHAGAYLPDWHPWEKLEDYYVYRKNTGGGRDEIAYELNWILGLMGRPKKITALTKKLGSFKADIYDVYDLLVEFENDSIGHIMVDVIQRPFGKICEIIGDKGYIQWDWERKIVRLFDAEPKKWSEYPESRDYKGYAIEPPRPGFAVGDIGQTECYVDEIKDFIDIVSGKKQPTFTFEDEKILLRLMYASEESSEKGIHIRL